MSCENSESFHVNSQHRNVKISSKLGERNVSVLGDKYFFKTEPREIQSRGETWKTGKYKYSGRDCAWPRKFFEEMWKVWLTEETSWTLVWNSTWVNKQYTIKDGSVGAGRTAGRLIMLNGIVNCAIKWCITCRFVIVCYLLSYCHYNFVIILSWKWYLVFSRNIISLIPTILQTMRHAY